MQNQANILNLVRKLMIKILNLKLEILLDILLSTAVRAEVVAKLLIQDISLLSSFIHHWEYY